MDIYYKIPAIHWRKYGQSLYWSEYPLNLIPKSLLSETDTTHMGTWNLHCIPHECGKVYTYCRQAASWKADAVGTPSTRVAAEHSDKWGHWITSKMSQY
jgi:hypothetical protein